MLTKKQQELLIFIHNRLSKDGVPPSFDEMKDAVGLKSKSGIHRLVSGLEERGFIRRLKHRARALEVLKLPENVPSKSTLEQAAPIETLPENVTRLHPSTEDVVTLPLYGRIAAGLPIEALRDESEFISVPAALIPSGEHYALEVDGDSMINAGILNGDTVIIKRCETVQDGEICVALVDDNEVTLKRFRQHGNIIALEAENPNYETRMLEADRVKVQGKLTALYRQY